MDSRPHDLCAMRMAWTVTEPSLCAERRRQHPPRIRSLPSAPSQRAGWAPGRCQSTGQEEALGQIGSVPKVLRPAIQRGRGAYATKPYVASPGGWDRPRVLRKTSQRDLPRHGPPSVLSPRGRARYSETPMKTVSQIIEAIKTRRREPCVSPCESVAGAPSLMPPRFSRQLPGGRGRLRAAPV